MKTPKIKTKLLATSTSVEGLQILINSYFYSTTKKIDGENVLNGDGMPLTGYRVVNKGGKFRFEEII